MLVFETRGWEFKSLRAGHINIAMAFNDEHNLQLLRDLAGRFPYNPPSYTCIREFTDNFPKSEPPVFTADPLLTKPAWVPEAPYPRIYTKNYRKTILSTLIQSIGKT